MDTARIGRIALSALVALLTPVAASALGIQVMIDGRAVVFEDVPQTAWFATYVRDCAEDGIVSGYRDARGNPTGEFGPSNSITIAEALKIAVEGAGYDEDAYSARINSGVRHWSSPYVAVAKAEGFAVITNSTRLDQPATRAEVAAIFTSAFRVPLDAPLGTRFTDVNLKTTYADSIETLSRDKVVSGDTGVDGNATGRYRPTEPINRAEVAKIVMDARGLYDHPGLNRSPDEEEGSIGGLTVNYTDAGFSPEVLRVRLGDTITFRNDATTGLWVASDPHPSHSSLPGFDAERTLITGETYLYTFTRLGTWGYHNHLSASHKATIIVEE